MRILWVIFFILLCILLARVFDLVTTVQDFVVKALGGFGVHVTVFPVYPIVVSVISAGLTASVIYIALAIAKAIREERGG